MRKERGETNTRMCFWLNLWKGNGLWSVNDVLWGFYTLPLALGLMAKRGRRMDVGVRGQRDRD